ncbi:MAG TPA: cbb3-type cytochrome c oxidase N-terminal domain-containing protein, partial [Taishania sp.]|nr:cbb3-type cytochrome c oxidase N-terminal domain-containing protein [Taishania sp.]
MKNQNKKNMVNTIVQKIKMNRLPLLVLFGSFFIGNEALALKFNEANEGPWLLVENSDLVFMAIINLILVGVLIYFKSIFNNLLKKFAQSNTEEKSAKATGTFSKILTDAVPIEEEDKITLDHEYDGIRELDNNLPPWWVALLVGTM